MCPRVGNCCRPCRTDLLSNPVRYKVFGAVWHKHDNCFCYVRGIVNVQRLEGSMVMIPSEVRSLSASQWLQGLSAKGAPSQMGTPSSNGSTELPRDSTSISARAFQLNQAAGTSLKTNSDTPQSSGVSAAHHHHRHHSSHNQTGKTSVVNSVEADASDSQQATGGALASSANGSAATSSEPHRGSFIQELARKAANDIRAAYSPITAPEATPSPNRGSRSINVTA